MSSQFSSVQPLSRVRLHNPMNHSTPGLPVHVQNLKKIKFFPPDQANLPVSEAIRKRVSLGTLESVSHSVMPSSAIPWTVACQAPLSMEFSRQEYWSAQPFPYSLLQGIFPAQGSNPSLLQCRQILYHLSHQRSP